MEEVELRFGSIAAIYYEYLSSKTPRQMDLIDTWFPGLVIETDASDGETKVPAEYIDSAYMIHAVRYHGRLYSGDSKRVAQILGRLTGTAAGNREKERKSAELIQKHVAEQFTRDMELTPQLKENTAKLLDHLSEEQLNALYQQLFDLLYRLSDQRKVMDDYSRKTEPFAMDDEVFDGVVYNAAYQLNLSTFSGLCNAYLWLLTGGLLRNETGRVLRLYDSAFIAVRRQLSETGELEDKLNDLFHPETYEYTYSGDDLDNRFPGVEWYCDGCGAHLNEQEGFDDHLSEWKCRICGYPNQLSMELIYDNDEDWQNGIRSVDAEKFADAVARRREEIKGQKDGE
ncbi:MAG: hypothetical protein ACI4ET_07440 [Bilifractor sp.]